MTKGEKVLVGFLALVMFVAGALKLMSLKMEVELFYHIAEVAKLDGLWPMYLVGIIECILALMLIPSFSLKEKSVHQPEFVIQNVALLGIIGAMVGALGVEFIILKGQQMSFIFAFIVMAVAGMLLMKNAKLVADQV